MSEFKDHFSSGSEGYKTFRPNYPESLYKWLYTMVPHPATVWECGAGSGQATEQLAKHFDKVIATEPSAPQINQAPKLTNVEYQVCAAETFATQPESVDAIVVAQAIHWFDHDAFFNKVNEYLKPGGILAVFGYQLMLVNEQLDPLIQEFHDEIVGPYWPKERKIIMEGYKDIRFPFPPLECPSFEMSAEWSFDHLLGYLNTWSATKAYEKQTGNNPVALSAERLKAAWGEKEKRKVSWPLVLYVGRK